MVRTTVLLMKFYRKITRNYSTSYLTHLVFLGSGYLEFKDCKYGCGRVVLKETREVCSVKKYK